VEDVGLEAVASTPPAHPLLVVAVDAAGSPLHQQLDHLEGLRTAVDEVADEDGQAVLTAPGAVALVVAESLEQAFEFRRVSMYVADDVDAVKVPVVVPTRVVAHAR